MDDTVPREWQCPSANASEKTKLGWRREAVEQGAAWQQSQRGFSDWRRALDIISGNESQRDLLNYRSQLSGHRLKTNIRTMISGLANIRPLWGYNAGEAFKEYALTLNKATWALYLEGSWDQSIKEALAYAAATCTGWVRPVYRRDIRGRGNMEMLTYGQPCVLPVQLPANGNYKRAYAVTLLDETPIYEAHWRFSAYQDKLRPTASKYWYDSEIRKSGKANWGKRLLSLFNRRNEDDQRSELFCPIYWTTINDAAINETGVTMAMGEVGSSWYYEVPSYGSDVDDGNGGARKANENDARMYPQGRLMISSEDCVMYDGPGFNWGEEPLDLIPFTIDKWPWEPMGFSLVHDAWQLQKSIDEIDRECMDKVKALAGLPLGYPIGGVTEPEAKAFDPMEPNTRIGYDEQTVDQPFKPAVPIEVYKIHPEELAMREKFIEELDYIFQTRDIVELGKARALGKGMDQLEALISAQGPIVKDMSRSMEASLSELGKQVGYRILQYMTTARIMQYAGADGVSMEVFDYDPSSLVPSHIRGEKANDEQQNVIPSKYTKMQRAKWFAENVRFWLMPHSVHELTQMTQRLLLLQLRQRGFQISGSTVMKACNVPNVSEPDGNTEQEKFWKEKEDEIVHAARIQKIVEVLGIDQGLMGGGGKPNGSTHKGGRPPSAQAAPQMAQKDGGTRTVIKES
jgi:hypothetical protein